MDDIQSGQEKSVMVMISLPHKPFLASCFKLRETMPLIGFRSYEANYELP